MSTEMENYTVCILDSLKSLKMQQSFKTSAISLMLRINSSPRNTRKYYSLKPLYGNTESLFIALHRRCMPVVLRKTVNPNNYDFVTHDCIIVK